MIFSYVAPLFKSSTQRRGYRFAGLVLLGMLLTSQVAAQTENWRFKVFLGDDPIGQHTFTVISNGGQRQVSGNARFNVKFLGFNAYTYQHNNSEQWQGTCLTRISATTNDNGDALRVNGQRQGNVFQVVDSEGKASYPACVKSFAYWDLALMKSPQLLNSQTGELVNVRLSFVGNEKIIASGRTVNAKRYRLTGKDLQVDLWYSGQNRWLALESLIENGRRIRYELQ